MRRFVLSLSSGLFACLLLMSLLFLGRGSSESQLVGIAPSSSDFRAASLVQAPLPPAPPGYVPQFVTIPAEVPTIEAAGPAELVSDGMSVHSCTSDQPVAYTAKGVSSSRANAAGAFTASVSDSGMTVTDAEGDDLIQREGVSLSVPGEVHDITSDAISGEDLAVIEHESGSRLARVLANGDLSELALPPDAMAPREVEALPGGGAVVTMLQSASGEFADQVDAWYLSAGGEFTRLTDLTSMVDGDRWAAVKDVRRTAAGRVMATVFSAKGSGTVGDFRSYRFVFDPATGRTSVDAVGSGELVFDETADGTQLVGSSRVKSIEFVEMSNPMADPANADRVTASLDSAGRRCEVVTASLWGPDPDAVG